MNRSWIRILTALTVPCLALAVVGAQQAGTPQGAPPQGRGQQAPPAPTGPFAPEKYKDIQVLTDVPADQLDNTMRYFVAATGINCSGCHVRDQATGEFSYEKNDVRGKATARAMIKLVQTVNAGDFGGRINCGTCHAGRNQPAGLQPATMFTADQLAQMAAQAAAQAARQGGPGGPGAPGAPGGDRGGPPPAGAQGAPGGQPGGRGPQTPPPPIDDIINKYLDGLGGAAAVQKIQSRVITGTVTNRSAQSMAFTIEQKGNKYRETVQMQPDALTRGFDGTSAWQQSGTRVADFTEFLLAQTSRHADLMLPLQLKEKYPNLASGRPAQLPSATPGQPGTPVNVLSGSSLKYVTETFSFDATSGLLLRRRVVTTAGLRGSLIETFDYSDYRVVNGVKMPFEIKRTNWNTLDTLKVTDIKANTNIDDAKFAKPKG
jgi:hypothetical protein